MKKNWNLNSKLSQVFLVLILFISACSDPVVRDIYQLKIYTLEDENQELRIDKFLKDAFIPAAKRTGISHVGVFKPVEEDTLAGKLIDVLIPFSSISDFEKFGACLQDDMVYQSDGKDYIGAGHKDPPYKRIESVLLRSFKTMPEYGVPTHATPNDEQIYELRSYQGATEKLYEKKVEMFTEGGETSLFIDLDFQPIFFGEVISGSAMPNLMYLTTFESKESQAEYWDVFRSSPVWEALKKDEQYKHTVSHIDKFYLHPTAYSDL